MKRYKQNPYAVQKPWKPDLQHPQWLGLTSWYPFDGVRGVADREYVNGGGGFSRPLDYANSEAATIENGAMSGSPDAFVRIRETSLGGVVIDLPTPPYTIPYTILPITISFWVARWTDVGAAQVCSWIGHSGSWNGIYFGLAGPGSFIHVQNTDFGGGITGAVTTVDGVMMHYVGVCESLSSRKFYQNGVLVGTSSYSLADAGQGTLLFRLNDSWAGAHSAGIFIRDHRIYDRALNADEVWALYDPATRYALQRETVRRRSYSYLPVAPSGNPRLGDQHHALA